MAEIVNLRTRRKQEARATARKSGGVSAALHGRSKTERKLAQARAEKAARDLEAHRREGPEGEPAPER